MSTTDSSRRPVRAGIHSRRPGLAGPRRGAYGSRMVSNTQIELRVSRLENDRTAIYEILTDVAATQLVHTQRLDGIDNRLDGIDNRLDGIDNRLDGIDRSLAEIVRRLPEPPT